MKIQNFSQLWCLIKKISIEGKVFSSVDRVFVLGSEIAHDTQTFLQIR